MATLETPRLPPLAGPLEAVSATRERLLDTAEGLFAERGFRAASVRHITAAADCNLAAVSYHFGGKERLYEEMFRRRLSAMRQQRLETIDGVLREAGEGATLELLLRTFATVFLEPFVDQSRGRLLMQLFGRELAEPHLPAGVLAEMIEPVHSAFGDALVRLRPGLEPVTARQCSHSVVGLLVHALRLRSGFGPVSGSCRASLALPDLIEHVVAFSAAGIEALAQRDRVAAWPASPRPEEGR
jgi:AcrR family transcriptional regulator